MVLQRLPRRLSSFLGEGVEGCFREGSCCRAIPTWISPGTCLEPRACLQVRRDAGQILGRLVRAGAGRTSAELWWAAGDLARRSFLCDVDHCQLTHRREISRRNVETMVLFLAPRRPINYALVPLVATNRRTARDVRK
jgi:hypothetical protein